MAAEKDERWHALVGEAEGLGIAIDGRWSVATLEAKIREHAMPDEPTADGVMEGAEVDQPLTPENAVAVQHGLQRKLMAMGETVNPDWDITVLQAKISAKQREALMNEAASLGINTMGMNWSIEVLQAKIAEARTPIEPPDGIAVVAIGLAEGEGEEVTCISRKRVSLGNGQWVGFKEKARVPSDMAALLREKDLCL